MLINATKKASTMHARRNPNLSVTSTAYSQLSPPLSSATFLSPTVASRRGLLGPSPPPSPGLPSLIPRHGKKKPSSAHSRLVKRILYGTIGVAIVLWLVVRQIYVYRSRPVDSDEGEEWEMVGASSLPQEPSAIVVQDIKGSSKWTVSIPDGLGFPLRPGQYHDMCHQSMELSKQLRQDARNPLTKRMLGYYTKDQYYLDVQEAEEQGLLPPSKSQGRPKSFVDDEDIVANKGATDSMKVCDRSLTFVMETVDAGFGSTLLRLWMSYGLAKKENRAFFIDDTRWPYGKYSTYFRPPPSAGCLPPPTTHMVPCPHQARHIVVSASTTRQTFGHAFNEEFEDPRKMRVQRQHKIFALLRTGYESLFKLTGEDAQYVLNRTESIYGAVEKEGGISVGIHVRRGDKHPYEFQYQKDYIPLDRYINTAREMQAKKRQASPTLIVASDDPQVYETPEMRPSTVRAQDRIVLATKATLEAAHGKTNPWIDEVTGWEGGFYRDVFFSLGQPVGNANDMLELKTDSVPEDAMKIRELVARAYLLDLAVLSQADAVVCTVSSIGCRLLAVMMGWDSAITKGNWKNIDGDFDWRGIVW